MAKKQETDYTSINNLIQILQMQRNAAYDALAQCELDRATLAKQLAERTT